MAGNRAAIKQRIKSINATRKITGAMNLISNVKFQKEKTRLDNIAVYTGELRKIANEVFSGEQDFQHAFFQENDAASRYVIYIGSDLGLCGAYNANLTKFLLENVRKEDTLYVLGSNQYNAIVREGYQPINELTPSDGLDYRDIEDIAEEAIGLFLSGKVSSINIVYTRFVNTMTYEPYMLQVVPFVHEGASENRYVYLEPTPSEVIDKLVPLMIKDSFFTAYAEAKTSEQGSRRMAMENATDNAEELVEKLTLEYNQARQAAITQEITEIVGGADALKEGL